MSGLATGGLRIVIGREHNMERATWSTRSCFLLGVKVEVGIGCVRKWINPPAAYVPTPARIVVR